MVYVYDPYGVFIQATDGSLISEDDWDGSKTPNGIAVITDNCSFVIALQNACQTGCRWSTYATEVSGISTTTDRTVAITYYDGESQTTTLINQLGSEAVAANYCRNFTFPNGMQGYLGAAGEWQAALDNKDIIVSALNKCGGNAIPSTCWTSTQNGVNRSWSAMWSLNTIGTSGKTSNTGAYVRAFAPI